MVDSAVQTLLEQAIDTPCKLHLLMIFHEHPRLDADAKQIAAWSCRDIWSVTQALTELVEDGVLGATVDAQRTRYCYTPSSERIETIRKLVRNYDDPFTRDWIQSRVRELASYAPFNRPRPHHTYAIS